MTTAQNIKTPYDSTFYTTHSEGSFHSALAVVPMVMKLVRPSSVLDVGCGNGTWLAAFADAGVADYLGLDGDYVDRDQLMIPRNRFQPADLVSIPRIERTYDLAICLEVAEHLPEKSADGLIGFLTSTSPLVLFSAAVPGQGGTNHVNERWPHYWRERFDARDYLRLDPIRPQIWRDPRVEWWYKQNIYLFARKDIISTNAELRNELELANQSPFELLYDTVLSHLLPAPTFRGMVKALHTAAIRAIRQTVRRKKV